MTDDRVNELRSEELKNLLENVFTFIPVPSSYKQHKCEECGKGIVLQRDKVVTAGSGGQTNEITILHYCTKCSWYRVDEPYTSSDDY